MRRQLGRGDRQRAEEWWAVPGSVRFLRAGRCERRGQGNDRDADSSGRVRFVRREAGGTCRDDRSCGAVGRDTGGGSQERAEIAVRRRRVEREAGGLTTEYGGLVRPRAGAEGKRCAGLLSDEPSSR